MTLACEDAYSKLVDVVSVDDVDDVDDEERVSNNFVEILKLIFEATGLLRF